MKQKYWIKFHIYECPVCGRGYEERERIYNKLKPICDNERYIFHPHYDWCDVL